MGAISLRAKAALVLAKARGGTLSNPTGAGGSASGRQGWRGAQSGVCVGHGAGPWRYTGSRAFLAPSSSRRAHTSGYADAAGRSLVGVKCEGPAGKY